MPVVYWHTQVRRTEISAPFLHRKDSNRHSLSAFIYAKASNHEDDFTTREVILGLYRDKGT